MHTIYLVAEINPSTNQVEILHRHLTYMTCGMSFYLLQIVDEEDLKGLFEMAKQLGNERSQCLYVRTCGSVVEIEDHAL